MQQSANYGLKLMEGTDNVKRQDFVDNFTKIDTEMKAINDNGYPNITATGTNTYVGTTDRVKALGKGIKLTLFVGVDATGNCTLNLNSYGAKSIKDSFGNVVTNLKANIPYNICYNGTDFILQGKGGGGNTIASHVLNGDTFTSDSGQGTGTMTNKSGTTNGWCGYETITVQPHPSDNSQGLVTIPNTYNIPAYYDGTSKVTGNLANLNASNIRSGVVIGRNGGDSSNSIIGTFTNDAVLDPQYLLQGYSGYDDGVLKQGTMPNLSGNWQNGNLMGLYNSGNGYAPLIQIPRGYSDGGTNTYSLCADANFIASNIISGKNIYGLAGSATIESLGGRQFASGTMSEDCGTNSTIPYISDGTYGGHLTVTFPALSFTPRVFTVIAYRHFNGHPLCESYKYTAVNFDVFGWCISRSYTTEGITTGVSCSSLGETPTFPTITVTLTNIVNSVWKNTSGGTKTICWYAYA